MPSEFASAPIRIADVIDGHIHPSLCRMHSGDLLAVYNVEGGGGKELLKCRSNDGGLTWSAPASIPVIVDCSIYPGSLTTLKDGRILLNWCCYRNDHTQVWREPYYSISDDDGESWSSPHSYPLGDHGPSTCMRHPVVELSDSAWICPFYDRTVLYDPIVDRVSCFGDGRNHGLVPIVRTTGGTLLSGAPQEEAPVPVGVPGNMVYGLRSTDSGESWQEIGAFPHFGVAGYDLAVLDNNGILLTYIVYGIGADGEFSYELALSHDDGVTWDFERAVEIYSPGRRIMGRGWPRTVQVDDETLASVFYDLSPDQEGGPGLYLVRTDLAAFYS